MALILPKGIVVNSPQIGSTIERIKNDPLDLADIARFWKVYTTTKRRLLDPTAERLENYWWRIWGSRSRELDASTVARLFVHISEGDTFVPLRGPPNRYENEKPMNSAACIGKTASTTSVARVRNDSRSSTTLTSVTRTPAPMPPPILKKTRGPSANGPRPTARFISPPVSEDESGSTSTNKGVVQSPSPILEHTATIEEKIEKEKVDRKLMPAPASKKFVASASKKKRPIVVRRQSSQTSQSSNDSSARVPGGQGQQNRTLGRLPTLSVLPVRNQNTQENVAPRSTTSPTKRNPSRSASSTLGGTRKLASTREESIEIEPTQPGPSDNLQTLANNQVSVPQVSEAEFKVQRMLHDNVKTASMLPPETSSPDSPASTTSKDSSNGKPPGYRKSSGKNLLQHQSKGMVSSAPTLTDATGHLDLGNGSQIAAVPASPERPSKGKARALMKDLFTKKSFSQAAPSSPISGSLASSPSGPLSKSKSQLSLLLERDQARSLEPRTLPKHERKQSMK